MKKMVALLPVVVGAFLFSTSLEAASRGYLTTPGELTAIKTKADAGTEPYASAVNQVLTYATGSMPARTTGSSITCSASSTPAYMAQAGAARAYSYALRYR